MDQYCKKENIFFTEAERVQNRISVSKGYHKHFQKCIGRAFNHIKDIPDHPNLDKLLGGDEADFDPVVVSKKPIF